VKNSESFVKITLLLFITSKW